MSQLEGLLECSNRTLAEFDGARAWMRLYISSHRNLYFLLGPPGTDRCVVNCICTYRIQAPTEWENACLRFRFNLVEVVRKGRKPPFLLVDEHNGVSVLSNSIHVCRLSETGEEFRELLGYRGLLSDPSHDPEPDRTP